MPWNRDMLRAVDGEFSRAGGSTLLCDRAAGRGWDVTDWLSPVDGIRDLAARGADLVVINSFAQDAGGMPEAVAEAGGLGVPCIFADSTFLDVPVPQISFDNRSAGYEAARHLCQRGARRIVCLAPFRALWQTHRVKGAKAGAAADAVPVDVYPLDCPDPAPPSGLPAVGEERAVAFARQLFLSEGEAWLGTTDGLLAVLACNDPLAYGILGAADEMGLVPGRDLLVMGFDDRSEAAALGLSTMRAPARAVGREAVTTAVRMLNGERVPSRISVPWDLIARTSTNNGQLDRNKTSL
jgi:LacI family transcriptional regulator